MLLAFAELAKAFAGSGCCSLYPRPFSWLLGGPVSIQLLSSMRRMAAAAVAALLLVAGTANAIIFVGDFDPAFGPAFPNLGFRGQSTFDVSAGCLTSAGFHAEGGSCTI